MAAAAATGRRRRRPADRAVGRSLTAAALVTIAAGGDNLAAYIPLFRVGGATNLSAVAAVFVVGEVWSRGSSWPAAGTPRCGAS